MMKRNIWGGLCAIVPLLVLAYVSINSETDNEFALFNLENELVENNSDTFSNKLDIFFGPFIHQETIFLVCCCISFANFDSSVILVAQK